MLPKQTGAGKEIGCYLFIFRKINQRAVNVLREKSSYANLFFTPSLFSLSWTDFQTKRTSLNPASLASVSFTPRTCYGEVWSGKMNLRCISKSSPCPFQHTHAQRSLVFSSFGLSSSGYERWDFAWTSTLNGYCTVWRETLGGLFWFIFCLLRAKQMLQRLVPRLWKPPHSPLRSTAKYNT